MTRQKNINCIRSHSAKTALQHTDYDNHTLIWHFKSWRVHTQWSGPVQSDGWLDGQKKHTRSLQSFSACQCQGTFNLKIQRDAIPESFTCCWHQQQVWKDVILRQKVLLECCGRMCPSPNFKDMCVCPKWSRWTMRTKTLVCAHCELHGVASTELPYHVANI